MKQPKFTKGPWAVVLEKSDSGQPCASVVSTTAPHDYFPDCRKTITGWGCVRQSVADACLIAVAPEMYEELRRQFASQNCTCKLLSYVGEVPPCGKCRLGLLLTKAVTP